MLFNSFSFLIFFPAVFFLYFVLPNRYQRTFLLAASCYFYMSFIPKYILILFFLIVSDFFLAQYLDKKNGKTRGVFLSISVIFNIGILFIFKYFNFFNENISSLLNLLDITYSPAVLSLVLPLGLSFHVFQSLGYVIEVYKRKQAPETSLSLYALYVLFFPQLVAGPIERPQHLLPQIHKVKVFDYVLARKGLERILWGLFKKMVIADQIGQAIDPLYLNLPNETGSLILIAVLFTYQIYCDFSGYSDIALGSAMMLGYSLSENFNRPFASRTVTEFWRRWHISLSSWVRDYLYYPLILGWGKISKVRLYVSLFFTFVVIGLWHGPNWTFILFGVFHGIFIVTESLTDGLRKKILNTLRFLWLQRVFHLLQVITTFIFVAATCIFFRASTVKEGVYFIKKMIEKKEGLPFIDFSHFTKVTGSVVFCYIFIAIVGMEIVQYYMEKKQTQYLFEDKGKLVRYVWYYALTLSIIFFGFFGTQTFIYFQF